ncbi:hypothetical protein JCM10213_003038 [Rhodosporidiobolus nylandii]
MSDNPQQPTLTTAPSLPTDLDKPSSLPPPASSSLPTPPTTVEQSPPPAQPAQPADDFAIPPPSLAAVVAPPTPVDSQPVPPPPAAPLPAHLGLSAKLMHADSASSIAAQPPTPAPHFPPPAAATPQLSPDAAPLPPQLQQPERQQQEQQQEPEQQLEPNGFTHDHPVEVPLGAHPGLGAVPHEHAHSAVDVLADVAMGEAALGLADFAAGAGSADVRGGSPAVGPPEEATEYSPTLGKRSADEAAGYVQAGHGLNGANGSYGQAGAYANGGLYGGETGAEEREAKRLRVEAEPANAFDQPANAYDASANAFEQSANVFEQPGNAFAPSSATASPYSLDAPAVVEPTPSTSASLPPPAPAPASAVSPSPAVQGFDPSAFTTAPTLASTAPAYPPPTSSAPTISPSDLLALHQQSPLIAPPSAVPSGSSPVPPMSGSQPPQQPMYASPDAFAHQPQASTSAAAMASSLSQQGLPQLPPLGGVKVEEGAEGATGGTPAPAGPPPPPPMSILTKEQQKFAINMVRNLKRNKNAPPFLKPVDAVALLIPDYYKIILNPMDLGTVEARLQATGKAMAAAVKANRIYGRDYTLGAPGGKWEGQSPEEEHFKTYRSIEEFKTDLDRIWENCFRYNGPREKNPVSAMAGIMQDAAEKSFRACPFAPPVSPYPPPPEVKRAVPPMPFMPNVPHRPKREIHAPAKDLAYLESAGLGDPTAGGIYNLAGFPGMAGGMPGVPKQRKSSAKSAQEQLRFCKSVIKELFSKVHEGYAYPFYQPVDVSQYPTYLQYVQKPMDLSTIRSKLEHQQYPVPPYAAFENDVRLIFKNCYAFNPPGTVVNDWGHRLEAVFEHKWADRPMAYESSDDEEDGLSAMQQQLHLLQANIEAMQANKKAQKEAKRLQHMQQQRLAPPKPQKKPAAPQPNPYAMSAYASAPPPMPRPKKQNSNPRVGGAPTHKKKKKRDDDSDDYYDDDDGGAYYGGGGSSSSRRRAPAQPAMEEYVDFDMKRELAVKIVALDNDQLGEAINIIRAGRPELLGQANEEVELDIDQLDQTTLLNLYRYVCPDSKPATRPVAAGSQVAAGYGAPKQSKQNRNQRKNLDEEKEAERIEMLEARLREFDSGAAGGDLSRRGSETAVPPAGGEDGDQASSSSDDEASSDSESDDD